MGISSFLGQRCADKPPDLLQSLLALPSYVASLAAEALSGQQAPASAFEKLGITSAKRPNGPVLWFHALSIGESAVALPVIFRCLLEYNEHVHVLLTTCTQEAHALLQNSLPPRVTVQYLPVDNVVCMRQFIAHWRPQTCILMESPTWPALVECCAASSVRLALLNARLSSKVFLAWFNSLPRRALLGRMLSCFSLIVPQSDIDVGRFRILGATLSQMPGWCSDLKYAAALGTSVWHLWRPRPARIAALQRALSARPLWVAAYTAAGEEEAIGGCHVKLKTDWPGLITTVVPRTAARCREVAAVLEELSLKVVLWSQIVDVVAPAAAPLPQSSSASGSSNKGSGWLPTIFAPKGDSSKSGGSSSSSSSSRVQPAAGSSRAAAGDLVPAAAAVAASAADSEAAAAVLKGVDVLLVDVLADLPLMYSVAEIAFVGNSLLEGCGGHNLAEAAVAGCAVLIGEHAGHFNTMADELNQAAVIAAEEASAAVNSSGPLEDPFGYTGHNSGGGTTDAATAAAVPQLEGGEEPSPRDGSHWRGILEPQQQQQQLREASSSSALAHLQQGSRPSTAPAAVAYSQDGSGGSGSRRQQQQQLDSAGSSGNSAPLSGFASEQAAGSGGRSSNALSGRRTDETSTTRGAAAADSSAAPATTPATAHGGGSSNARHAHAWASYAATLGDQMTVGGVLSVLGEETGVLLDGPSLSLPTGSCHIYDHTREPVAPPPSAANSTPFGGTGEVTPEGSSGGGTASAERQERQMQQLDGYFNRVLGNAATMRQQQQLQQVYLQPSLTSQDSTGDGSSQQQQQQQHMLLRQQQRQHLLRRRAMAGAPSSSNSSTDGSGLQQQHQQHAIDGVLHQDALACPCSPHCPMTPNTPFPTPDDSAQTFGGRSPLSPYQLEGSVEPPPMQLNSAQLSTAQQQLLSQRMCRCSWGSGGGAPDSGRSTADGTAAAAAAADAGVAAAPAATGATVDALAGAVDRNGVSGDKTNSALCCNCCCHAPEQQQQQCGSSSCEVQMASRPETPQGAAAAAGAGETPVESLVDGQSISADELPGMLAPALILGDDAQQQQQQQCKGPLLYPEQQQPQQQSACLVGPQLQPGSAGYFLPHNTIDGSQQYAAEAAAEEAAAAELMQRCSYRPSNPAPPDCCSPLAGSSCSSPVVTPRAAAAEVGAGSSSSSNRVLTMRRSYAGPSSSSGSSGGMTSSRYRHAGGWRGGSTGGEPMTSISPEAGVIHEVGAATEAVVSADQATDAVATEAVAAPTGANLLSLFTNSISVEEGIRGDGSADGMGPNVEGGMQSSTAAGDESAGGHVRMGRSPTICELVRCDESCASSMTAAAGDSEAAAAAVGQPGVDLFPGASRASSAQVATVKPGASEGKQQQQLPQQDRSCEGVIAEQGSMGWEQWGQQHCNGYAQCSGCTSGSGQSAAAAVIPDVPATNSSSAFAAASGVAAAAAAAADVCPTSSSSIVAVAPAVSSSVVSRLGDPARSTHYMDLPAQSPNMRINLPQRSTSADSDCMYVANPQSSSAASSGSSYYQQYSMSAAPSGMSEYRSAALTPQPAPTGDSGGATPGSRAAAVAAAGGPSAWAQQQQQQQQGPYSAAGYFFDGGSSMSLQQLELGGATPSSVASGFSPTSTATSLAATPMFSNPWPSHQQQQQQQLLPPTAAAAAAAAARLARRGSRGQSTMSALSNVSTLSNISSLDGGMSRDERLHSGDGAAWGRLSGLDTPGAGLSQCGSEAPTPHGFRTPTHRAGAGAGIGDHGAMPGTSYLRYRGDYILPATHLPYAPHGPAVWRVAGAEGLASAVGTLLREPLERRSRGHAATQAAAKLASGLVSTVWHVVDDMVVAPALQEYVASHGTPGPAAAQAARAPTRVLGHSAARN